MLDKIKNGTADHEAGRSVEPTERLYRPSDKEPFMNERQREYFRLKLLDWRQDIFKEAKETRRCTHDTERHDRDARRNAYLRCFR